jgi:hypothetical protein
MPKIFDNQTIIIQGGAGSANVEWGPTFGEPQELIVGAHMDMTFGPLEGFQTVGASITMTDLDVVYRDDILSVGAQATIPALALVGTTDDVGCHISQPALALVGNADNVGCQITAPAMALAHMKTVGGHISGTALGAPFWQAVTTANPSGDANNITINVPAGTSDGDLLLLIVGTNSGADDPNINTPAGWNLIQHTDVIMINLASFWRIASSEPASYNVTFANLATRRLAEMHRIIGTHPTTPLDASSEDFLEPTTLDPDPSAPAVTTVADNCLVFAVLLHEHLLLSNTHTPPPNHVERTDIEDPDQNKTSLTSATRVFATPGNQAAVEFNCTETVATAACMQRISIAPGTLTLAS